MNIEPLIVKKRDGGALTRPEIESFITAFTAGRTPDYQVAALLMAIVLNGMTDSETVDLTRAMVESGETLDLSRLSRPAIDKHSTGGVGDTTTLIVGPILAALGFAVPKLSGRGLGFTGGTLDKLESIPGFTVDLTSDRLIEQTERIGLAIAAQSQMLVPADRALYALRDVTGTVPSVPLITSSILSKKIASGASTIVIDVKCGDGAFMPDARSAHTLATELETVGRALGKNVSTVVSRMDAPLAPAVGNALEIRAAIDALSGRIEGALVSLALHLASIAAHAADPSRTIEEWLMSASQVLASGGALDRFRAMVAAQGGDPSVVDDTDLLGWAPFTAEVRAERAGYVSTLPARAFGEVARDLGAGRSALGQSIDPVAGITLDLTRGEWVEAGDTIATCHTSSEDLLGSAVDRLRSAIGITDAPFMED